MNLLTLDIGNTRIGWALFAEDRLLRRMRAAPDEAVAAAARYCAEVPAAAPDLAVAACVNPDRLEERLRPLTERMGRPPALLNRDVPFPLEHRLQRPDKTGADRLAAALGALATVGAPAIVVDAGTAVTVDVLDPAGVFLGGAILPGLATQLWSLRARTALLPEVTVTAPPATSIGDETVSAIRAGVWFGLVGGVERLVAEARGRVGAAAPVVVTGGDAAMLAAGSPVLGRVDDALIHHGMAEWVRRARQAGWSPP